MNGSWWRDPDYRRDVLIVVGLFGLGLVFNVVVGAVVFVLFESVLSVNAGFAGPAYAGADT